MISNNRICFLGSGSIAEAMIAGMLAKKLLHADNITVINRSNKERLYHLINKYNVNSTENKVKAINEADILILAMKPKDIGESLIEIRPFIHQKQLIISVVAGVTTGYITELLQQNVPIVRAMPNTSSMVGLSATAMSLGEYASAKNDRTAQTILEAIGTVTIVEEKQLDAVTGLSGSGPAYIYYLMEAMEEAAVQLGMDKHIARELIIQTILGAGHMLKETGEDPSVLREKVTSPGGTTMAGIETMKNFQFQEALIQGIKRATERSKELGKQFIEISS